MQFGELLDLLKCVQFLDQTELVCNLKLVSFTAGLITCASSILLARIIILNEWLSKFHLIDANLKENLICLTWLDAKNVVIVIVSVATHRVNNVNEVGDFGIQLHLEISYSDISVLSLRG